LLRTICVTARIVGLMYSYSVLARMSGNPSSYAHVWDALGYSVHVVTVRSNGAWDHFVLVTVLIIVTKQCNRYVDDLVRVV